VSSSLLLRAARSAGFRHLVRAWSEIAHSMSFNRGCRPGRWPERLKVEVLYLGQRSQGRTLPPASQGFGVVIGVRRASGEYQFQQQSKNLRKVSVSNLPKALVRFRLISLSSGQFLMFASAALESVFRHRT